MKRVAHFIASSRDGRSYTAYPPMTSFASVNGPSSTVSLPPVSRTRPPFAVGASPPLSTRTPACAASIPRFMIASISALGGGPEFSADFTIVMNFIAVVPVVPDVSGRELRVARQEELEYARVAKRQSAPEHQAEQGGKDDGKRAGLNTHL